MQKCLYHISVCIQLLFTSAPFIFTPSSSPASIASPPAVGWKQYSYSSSKRRTDERSLADKGIA